MLFSNPLFSSSLEGIGQKSMLAEMIVEIFMREAKHKLVLKCDQDLEQKEKRKGGRKGGKKCGQEETDIYWGLKVSETRVNILDMVLQQLLKCS